MITTQIYLFDDSKKKATQKLLDENELLGFEKHKVDLNDLNVKYKLTDYFFSEKDFNGFWIDPDKDDDYGIRDIIFYVGSVSFRTPNTKEKILEFIKIIDQK